jgi:hypothetical protein
VVQRFLCIKLNFNAMTYNHSTYNSIHPLHKEISELELLIGHSFENFNSNSLSISIAKLVNDLRARCIDVLLHLSLEEVRKIAFSKYYLDGDKDFINTYKKLNNMEKLQIIKQEKIAAVRAHNFTQAAEYRDMEKAIVEMINSGRNDDSKINISVFPQKTLKTAIEICEREIHVYVITAYEPFEQMIRELFN